MLDLHGIEQGEVQAVPVAHHGRRPGCPLYRLAHAVDLIGIGDHDLQPGDGVGEIEIELRLLHGHEDDGVVVLGSAGVEIAGDRVGP